MTRPASDVRAALAAAAGDAAGLIHSAVGPWYYLTRDDALDTDTRLLAPVALAVSARDQDRAAGELARAVETAEAGPAPAHLTTQQAIRLVQRARALAGASAFDTYQEQWSDAPARPQATARTVIVGRGVDTLELGWVVRLRADVLDRLSQLRELAEAKTARVMVARHAWRWEVRPHGARPFWSYVLIGPACTLRIRRTVPRGEGAAAAAVAVKISAAWLARDGVDACVETLRVLLQDWSEPGAPEPVAWVTRIDLAVDWQGWVPTGAEVLRGTVVTRGRYRVVDRDGAAGDRSSSRRVSGDTNSADTRHSREFWLGLHFTGYQFGRDATMVRVYDKTRELRHSGKAWLQAAWSYVAGYDPARPVWRVEAQLRSEALTNLLLAFDGDSEIGLAGSARAGELAHGRRWREVRAALDGLWGKMLGRHGRAGWLTWRVHPEDDEWSGPRDGNRSRWPVAARWRDLGAVRWPGAGRVRVDQVRWPRARADATHGQRPARLAGDAQRLPLARDGGVLYREDTGEVLRAADDLGSPLDLSALAVALGTAGALELVGSGARAPGTGHPTADLDTAAGRLVRLRPQAAGLLASLLASLDIEAARADPDTEDEARARAHRALDALLSDTDLLARVAAARDTQACRAGVRLDLALQLEAHGGGGS